MLINTPVYHETFKLGDYVTLSSPTKNPTNRAQQSVWLQLEFGLRGIVCGIIGPSSDSSSQLVCVSVPGHKCWFFSHQLQNAASQPPVPPLLARFAKYDNVILLRSISGYPAGTLGSILQLLPQTDDATIPPLGLVLIGNTSILAPLRLLKSKNR